MATHRALNHARRDTERAWGRPITDGVWSLVEQDVAVVLDRDGQAAGVQEALRGLRREFPPRRRPASDEITGHIADDLMARAEALSVWAAWLCGERPGTMDPDDPAAGEAWERALERHDVGPLAEQRRVADLCRQWSWNVGEYYWWRITGEPPLVRPIDNHVQHRSGTRTDHPVMGAVSHDAFTRVVLEVDPMVSPDQLARYWTQVRAQLRHGERNRPMGARALRLATWVAGAPGLSWAELMRAWNKHDPEPFHDRANFRTAVCESVGRLLGLRYRAALDRVPRKSREPS